MNANENRKYMEAIREMVNHKGGFHVPTILKNHRVPITCTTALRKLGWTKGHSRKGSFWIATKPKTDGELLTMAVTMRVKLEEINKEMNEKYYKAKKTVVKQANERAKAPVVKAERPKQDKLVIIQEAPVKTVAVPKPVVRRTPARREVSILWGMIKWTR